MGSHRQRALPEAMAETGEVDIYRDTPLRYLGYANEVGEAFRALMHVRWVRATYGVASAYVLADTYDKGVKQSKEPRQVKLQSQLWILCYGRPWLQLLSQVSQ